MYSIPNTVRGARAGAAQWRLGHRPVQWPAPGPPHEPLAPGQERQGWALTEPRRAGAQIMPLFGGAITDRLGVRSAAVLYSAVRLMTL